MSNPFKSIYIALRNTLSRIKPPFFDGLSVWDVLYFFFQGIYEGAISTRAGSVSFSFFLALFPGIIFIFTLIAYLPIDTFQMELFTLLGDVLPPSTHDMAFDAIEDILTIKRGGLLSVTFIAAMLFATNGTLSLVSNLGISYNINDAKNFWWQYLSAFLLTIALTLLILVALVALIFTQGFTGWLANQGYILAYSAIIIYWLRLFVLLAAILVGISLVYNYGPVRGTDWRFISPGSILATILIILSSNGFGYYVENFSTYNKFYGSIGTLLIMLLWIYVNAFGLIIGFELNASVSGAKHDRELKNS
ncbi:MAG TPA: ribonuclease BN [Cryomorphaceae bacterium]|nr:ribonuclease BN [Cryomorphaceae bacterium]|tara:strand:+ start:2822 stop:3739 length:918 start_codon:yes stop_codon:yes gene_type:complete